MRTITKFISESKIDIQNLWHSGSELPKESSFTKPSDNKKFNKIIPIIVIAGGKVNTKKHLDTYDNVKIANYMNDGEYIVGTERKELTDQDKWCYLTDILP